MAWTGDKKAIVAALVEHITADMRRNMAGQQATHEGATHAEAKPENDKDTRAIEAQYLARGLAMRVEQQRDDIARLQAMRLASFDEETPIALSAVVELVDAAEAPERYFITAVGGGLRVRVEGVDLIAVTASSPMGRALLGRFVDDDITVPTPSGPRYLSVVSVS